MNPSPLDAALAALRYWAMGEDPPDPQRDCVQHTKSLLLSGFNSADSGPLESIFNRIRLDDTPQITAYLRSATLRLDREILFPQEQSASGDDVASRLHTELTELDRRKLAGKALLEGTLFALQRHAWALPSPLPAVSLYDFARTHAALAAALANNPNGEICLLGGDLSGVQDFIYSVSAKGAAKQLRGRSLYLQLLTDACAHRVLTTVGMPLCNLLYAGGGHFYALLPGSAREQVDALRAEIGKKLLDAHRGTLYLALGGTRFAPVTYGKDTWAAMSAEIEHDKRRRFASLSKDDFATLFTPRQPEPPKEEGAEEPLDTLDKSLEDLGGSLSRATVLTAEPVVADSIRGQRWGDLPASLGLRVNPRDAEPTYRVQTGSYRRLLFLADSELDSQPMPGDVLGTRYTVTEAPTASAEDVTEYFRLGLDDDGQEFKQGDVLPFNLLAAYSQGVARIGVLRMDVDNLGDLFGTKLTRPDGVAALAYTAALSAALSRFFEGWVGELCRKVNENGSGGKVYAVYSGGDDLFLLGSWHLIPGLARQIRDDFAAYVRGRRLKQDDERPPITLSAGITLHGGSYPLYQAADDAAEALDAAKLFTRPDERKKDAITFLGRTLGWEQFAKAEKLCTHLVNLVQKQGAPRALLMTIQSLDTQAHATRRRNRAGTAQLAYGPWVWQGTYQLTRLAERTSGAAREQIENLREQIVGTSTISLDTIMQAGLAARWAQLLIRGERRDMHDDQENDHDLPE